VTFWVVVLVGMLRTFVTARVTAQDEDRARARLILERHGNTTLAYMTTWDGNSYWFSADGESYVAYRVEGGVAITTGDPVGPADDLERTVHEFVGFCNDHAWTPCLYSTTEATKQVTDQLGWPALQVAEETVLRLGSLAFSGKKFQDIRSSISRAKKAGIGAEWIVFPDAPLAIRDQIEAISEEWVSDKALPEMGFTLGGIDELNDEHVRCLIAVDADRTVHGVTSWMPSYRDGEPVGWTLDFMRRRTAGDVKGIMEFLIGTAALDVQSEGAEFLSMSGAPLAQANQSAELTGVQKLLDYIGRTMEPVYGFRSLLRFKAKFQPQYEPMYMCYPETAALPRIGLGISHAYLPHLTMAQTVRMMGQLR
jgi:phosphatidylglycerol lysyltransferase